nr:MAG TPA: hypothetical protein [Caudoviricetes sp.]
MPKSSTLQNLTATCAIPKLGEKKRKNLKKPAIFPHINSGLSHEELPKSMFSCLI